MLSHYGGLFSKAMDGALLAPKIAGGNKSKAEEYFNQAVKADPLFADAYVRFAQLAGINGNREKCDFYMNKVFEIDPRNELVLDAKSGSCKFICGQER